MTYRDDVDTLKSELVERLRLIAERITQSFWRRR